MTTERHASSVFVQWKGTDVCLDLHCRCGHDGHFDGDFAYFLRCVACGRVYEMPHTFFLVEVSEDRAGVIQEPIGEPHPHRDGGPAVVEVNDTWALPEQP